MCAERRARARALGFIVHGARDWRGELLRGCDELPLWLGLMVAVIVLPSALGYLVAMCGGGS